MVIETLSVSESSFPSFTTSAITITESRCTNGAVNVGLLMVVEDKVMIEGAIHLNVMGSLSGSDESEPSS